MRATEFVVEGFWDRLKAKFTTGAARKQFEKEINDAFKLTLPKWAYRLEQLKRNPAIAGSPDKVKDELVKWSNDWMRGFGNTSVPDPVIANVNDTAAMQAYIKDRIAEFLEKREGAKLTGGAGSSGPAAPAAPAPTATIPGLAPDMQVVSVDPIILRYRKKDFYQHGRYDRWVQDMNGRPGPYLNVKWQRFFDAQHEKVKDSLTPTPTPESKQPLSEGGNVFKEKDGSPATQRINRSDVVPTVTWLEKLTGLSLTDNMLGSTGINPTSGDLDLAVDTKYKNDLVEKLQAWASENKVDPRDYIRKTGISVHFRTPILGDSSNGFVQTDFMFGDPTWMKFAMHGAEPNSKFKGLHRAVLLSSIAKVYGLKWSPTLGLVSRETNQVITRDPDQIANYLLGQSAKGEDLMSVERIMNKIRTQPNFQELIAQAKETLAAEKLDLV